MNKKLLVVYNPKKENVKEIVKKITLKIKNLCNVEICSSEKINYKICNADLILTLGGDGTILKVGQYAVLKSIPVLGANLGGLGYLAEFQVGEIFDVIKKFFLGEITPQERMVLSIIYKNREFFAINDVVVKPFSSKVCNVEVKIDKKTITQIIGDGVIVATPTGSTAYSLACGGSIVEPDAEVILITPISPHTLSIRPIIISSDKEIYLRIPLYKSNKKLIFSLDGQRNFNIKPLDEILVKKAEKRLLFIPNFKKDFYKILTQKLSWGKR
jgi:NAD+ kinase